jgi:hypothetical protein
MLNLKMCEHRHGHNLENDLQSLFTYSLDSHFNTKQIAGKRKKNTWRVRITNGSFPDKITHMKWNDITGEPRYTRFRSMRVSVNTVTNIYTTPLHVPPKISNSAADYETKKFLTQKKSHKNCRRQTVLPDCASAAPLCYHKLSFA